MPARQRRSGADGQAIIHRGRIIGVRVIVMVLCFIAGCPLLISATGHQPMGSANGRYVVVLMVRYIIIFAPRTA